MSPQVNISKPVQHLVIRACQLEQPELSGDPPLTGGSALYRLVDGGMTICARHLLELGTYQPRTEAHVVLTLDKIESIVAELDLLVAAAADVAARLPLVAARSRTLDFVHLRLETGSSTS